MGAPCPLGNATCDYDPRLQRHSHVSADLIATAARCSCGALAWRIRFGGLLPARLMCARCQAGMNLTEHLRRLQADPGVTRRSNRG